MQNMSGGKNVLGLDSNITALIGYLIGIVALILIFIEKDNKFVRFHAFQSVIYHAAVMCLVFAFIFLTTILAFISSTLATLFSLLFTLVWLGVLVGIFFLAFKAYKGEMFKLPVIGDLADKWSN